MRGTVPATVSVAGTLAGVCVVNSGTKMTGDAIANLNLGRLWVASRLDVGECPLLVKTLLSFCQQFATSTPPSVAKFG